MKKPTCLCFVTGLLLLVLNANLSLASVTVKLSGTTLNIKGDGGSDSVVLNGFGLGVVDVVINGGWPTTYVNVKNIKADMGGNVDLAYSNNVSISGNLTIDMGGDLGDVCFCVNGSFGGNLNIKEASDTVLVQVMIGKNLTLSSNLPLDLSGDGFTQSVVNSMVGGTSTINGSDAPESVLVLNSFFGSRNIKLGSGDDTLILSNNLVNGNHSVDGGRGTDSLTETDTVTGRISRRNLELIIL